MTATVYDLLADKERAELPGGDGTAPNPGTDEYAAVREREAGLLRELRGRAAERYRDLGLELGRLHSMITGASEVLRVAGIESDQLSRDHWERIHVPSCRGLAPLRDAGRVSHPTWNTRSLAGSIDAAEVQGDGDAAFRSTVRALEERLGFFPLGRVR